jgi:hypothetical protein
LTDLDGNGTTEPFREGVYVYLVPGRSLSGLGGIRTTMLFRNSGYTEPTVVTPDSSTTFYDPHRRIEVSVSSMNNAWAKVTLRKK